MEIRTPEYRKAVRILVILGIGAACVKLTLTLLTVGTNDVNSFWVFNETNREIGVLRVYEWDRLLNHPPFILHFLRLLDWLAQGDQFRFGNWLRIFQTIADAGSLYLIYRISREVFGERLRFAPLWLVAIAPASIFISGFHGNTDPMMMFFILLAIFFATVRQAIWLTGAAFGMSCNIKIWPIVLIPIFFFYFNKWGHRIQFFLVAGAVVFFGFFPYIVDYPSLIVSRVLGYGSAPGFWGITRAMSFRQSLAMWNVAYVEYGRFVVAGAIVAAAFVMNRVRVRPPLFAQCGIAANLFMALTPGFGVQYLAWLMPWLAWTAVWYSLAFHLATGTFLFLVYTFWCEGLPWSTADASVGPWPPRAIVFELASWMFVLWYVAMAGFRLYESQKSGTIQTGPAEGGDSEAEPRRGRRRKAIAK